MAWRAATEDDLLASISNAELEAYRAAVTKPGQTDPVTRKLADVTNMVRGYIAANADNVLGLDGTLPDKLIGPAMDYLAVDVIKRIPRREVSQERSDARKAAIRLFRDVADDKFAIDEPDEPSDEQHGAPSPSFEGRDRVFKRTDQDGI